MDWILYLLGLLSHTIIPPGKLAELLEHVNMELIEHFKEYELAMTKIHQYYDLSLVSYSYTGACSFCKFQSISNITNYRHWNCLVYRQLQCHIIQIVNLQMAIKPTHG